MLKDITLIKLVVFREMVKKKKMIVEITKSILLQYSMLSILSLILERTNGCCTFGWDLSKNFSFPGLSMAH